VETALRAVASGHAGADEAVLRLGRKVLPDLRRAEANADGDARVRFAALRNEIEMSRPRVLWVEQHPRPIYKSTKSVLLNDRGYVVQTLQLGTAHSEASPWLVQYPFRSEIRDIPMDDLASYDVLMLGDLKVDGREAFQGAVQHFTLALGGSVCVIAGEHSADVTTACASIVPVELTQAARPQQVYVRVTTAGRSHPATNVSAAEPRDEWFGSCAALRWYQTVRVKPGASALVETREGAPILAAWEIGRGRVAYVASDDQQNWEPDRRVAFFRTVLNYLGRRE
jgi:hypothetical protein